MASNKRFRSGPIALTTTMTTNLLNPAGASGGVNGGSSGQYIIINHARIVNKTAGAVTCSFWLGASGANTAGTEVIGQGLSVPANSYVDFYGTLRLDTADFLVGGASANASLSITVSGEVGVEG